MVMYRGLVFTGLLVATGRVIVEGSTVSESNNHTTTIHGIPPERQYLYQPIKGTGNQWACLNNTDTIIDISRINDGVCDCADGSDEPATGACGSRGPNFYCANEGFISRFIPQSQVNDGVCDCCDCSDEDLSPVKPFSRKSDCFTLNNAFERLVKEELKEYEKGLDSLNITQTGLDSENSEVVIENLQKEIDTLQQNLAISEQHLNTVREKYLRQLKTDNPLFYKFQQLDTDYVTQVVNASFIDIIAMSKAYEELIEILNGLETSYTKSLNDRVVNSNVKKFRFMRNQQLNKLNVNSKVEDDQRRELLHYFKDELPKIYMEGKTEKSPTYFIGKMVFIDVLVTERTEYTATVIDVIGKLTELLNDISKNYNVNYQDTAVKQSVELYNNWLGQHTSLKELKLSEKFLKQFGELKEFVQTSSAQIVSSEMSLKEHIFDPKTIGQHLKFLLSVVKQSFKPDLSIQLEEYQQTVAQLKDQLEGKKSKFSSLKSAGNYDKFSYIQELVLEGLLNCVQGSISGYLYDICLNQGIHQREQAPPQRTVSVGNFKRIQFDDDETRREKYMEHLKIKYPDEMDLLTELVSEQDSIQHYLFGNLYDMSNGLAIRFEGGNKCWNGPERSATVFISCGSDAEIMKVYETSRCNYGIEMKAPIGCNPYFGSFRKQELLQSF